MRKLFACLSLCLFVFGLTFGEASAAPGKQFSPKELESIKQYLFQLERTTWPKSGFIDQVYSPMNDVEAATFVFGVVTNNFYPFCHELPSDQMNRVRLPIKDAEVFATAYVKMDDIKAAAKDILGYTLTLPDNFSAPIPSQSAVAQNGVFYYQAGDQGISPEYKILSASEDNYGLIRISAQKYDPETESPLGTYIILLREKKLLRNYQNKDLPDGGDNKIWEVVFFKRAK